MTVHPAGVLAYSRKRPLSADELCETKCNFSVLS
jgi:hypothetical protein